MSPCPAIARSSAWSLRLAIVVAAVGGVSFASVIALGAEPTLAASRPRARGEVMVQIAPTTVETTKVDVARVVAVRPPAKPDYVRTSPTMRAQTTTQAPAWERFTGDIGDGPFRVARANAAGLAVSVRRNDPAATTLSNPLASGAPRVVLVLKEQDGWFEVLLPLRPNSSLGWVRASDVTVETTTYHGVVDRAHRRLVMYDGTRVILDEAVAVGKPASPTPSGVFYTTELLEPPSGSDGPYGPYSFGLSGHSDVYQRFGSGDGQLGLHGTNEPSTIGSDASNGCVRASNDTISYLASFLPLGAPITIL